jgi:hypothetical protein
MNLRLAGVFFLIFATGHKKKEESNLPPPITLSVSSTTKLDIPFFATSGQGRSDDRGNLYFHAATRSYNNSSLIEISRKTSQPNFFVLPDEFAKKTFFESFFVTPSGSVYIVAEAAGHSRIVFEFGPDGEVTRHTTLESPSDVGIETVAVFEDGNFFVLGYHGTDATAEMKGRPFVGIFDSAGRLVRELKDSNIPKNLSLGETPQTAKPSEVWSSVADDGNLYLLASDQILVINESGGIVRRIKFQKPENNPAAVKIEVSEGLAAIWLTDEIGPKRTIRLRLEVIDLGTGKVTAIYSPSSELGTNAVSFSRKEGFVFLSSEGDNKITLLTAALR